MALGSFVSIGLRSDPFGASRLICPWSCANSINSSTVASNSSHLSMLKESSSSLKRGWKLSDGAVSSGLGSALEIPDRSHHCQILVSLAGQYPRVIFIRRKDLGCCVSRLVESCVNYW